MILQHYWRIITLKKYDIMHYSLAEVKNAFLTLLDHIPALIVVKFKNVSQKNYKK